jgi:hypothetical protein
MIPIDACRKYIANKNCYYLAKEDLVVYYSSDTGRASDAKWHKMTLAQTYRIISSIHYKTFDSGFLVQAFQEEGRVFERGVNSRHKVVEGLFNYQEHCTDALIDKLFYEAVSLLRQMGYTAITSKSLHDLFAGLLDRTGVDSENYADAFTKALEAHGFDLRNGSRRPRVNGVLVTAALLPSSTPSAIESVATHHHDTIIKKLMKEYE